jgi:hypothetical protein
MTDLGVYADGAGSAGPAGPPAVVVRHEPLTYERRGRHSFFADLIAGMLRGDRLAERRIERHGAEMRVEQARFEDRARRTLSERGFELGERRVTPTAVTSDFALPLWMNQWFASADRPHRILADMVPTFPLPLGCHSVSVPRITVGNLVDPDQETGPVPGRDVTDAGVTAVVVAIAGIGDVSLQLLEQSPVGAHLDWAWFKDLSESYDHKLEKGLLVGSGTGENIAGLFGLAPTANTITDGTTVTGASLWTDVAKAYAAVGDNRLMPPQVVLMRSGRWAWLGAQGDTSFRPFTTPGDPRDYDEPLPDGAFAVGSVFGVPIYPNDSIPATLGVGGTQDTVILCRPADIILLEGTPKASVALEPLSGTLGARIQYRNSVAAITGRHPNGIGVVTGAGMAYPAGY